MYLVSIPVENKEFGTPMKIPSECRWVPHVRSVGSEWADEYWTPLYFKSWIKSLIILDFIRNLKSLSIPDKNEHLIYAA